MSAPSHGATTVVNVHTDEYDLLIDRTTRWGNPFHAGPDGSLAQVLERYRRHVLSSKDLLSALEELRGRRLGCHCAPQPCHGHVLVELLGPDLCSQCGGPLPCDPVGCANEEVP